MRHCPTCWCRMVEHDDPLREVLISRMSALHVLCARCRYPAIPSHLDSRGWCEVCTHTQQNTQRVKRRRFIEKEARQCGPVLECGLHVVS